MKHLEESNETYLSHLLFASKAALHLCLSGVFLMIHGLLPFWNQPESFRITSTCKKIQKWNDHIQERKNK